MGELVDAESIEDVFEFLEVELKVIAEAAATIILVTKGAEICFFLALGDSRTFTTLNWIDVLSGLNHGVELLSTALPISREASRFWTETENFLLTFVLHHFFGHVLDNFDVILLQFLDIVVFEALVVREFASAVFFAAHLALDHHLGAVSLDVLAELGPGHALVLGEVADVAAVLGALVVVGVALEFSDGLPEDLAVLQLIALVGELTEVDAVSNDGVNFGEEIALAFTVGALHHLGAPIIKLHLRSSVSGQPSHGLGSPGIGTSLELFAGFLHHGLDSGFVLHELGVLLQLDLAVLAEDFVALSALEGHVREKTAHDTPDFFRQLPLELVLNLVVLNVDGRNRIWSHDFINSAIGQHQIVPHLHIKTLLIRTHFLGETLGINDVRSWTSDWAPIGLSHHLWRAVSCAFHIFFRYIFFKIYLFYLINKIVKNLYLL